MSQPVRVKKSRRLEGVRALPPTTKVPKQQSAEDAAHALAKAARQRAREAQQATVTRIRSLEDELYESKKAMNNIATLQLYLKLKPAGDSLDGEDDTYSAPVVIAASQALRRVFVANLKQRTFALNSSLENARAAASAAAAGTASAAAAAAAQSAQRKIQSWLASQCQKYAQALVSLIAFSDRDSVSDGVVVAAIDSLIDLAVAGAGEDVAKLSAIDTVNPLGHLLLALVLVPSRSPAHFTHLRASWLDKYDDLRLACLRLLRRFSTSTTLTTSSRARPSDEDGEGDAFATLPIVAAVRAAGAPAPTAVYENIFVLLCDIKPQSMTGASILPQAANARAPKLTELSQKQRAAMNDAWIALLRHAFSTEGYKRVLMATESVIIPALTNPVALADFLTDSYNLGGVASVLALGGLFHLITRHGLEYPRFFPRLYAVCDATALTAKYRGRFFKLLSIVLSGAYLPSYLIAAFAKRLCRLALLAPPPAATFVLALVFNLIRRHPMVASLINRSIAVHRGAIKASVMPSSEFGKLYRLDADNTAVETAAEGLETAEDASGAGAVAAPAPARPLSLFAAIESAAAASGQGAQSVAAGAAAGAALQSLLPGAKTAAAIKKAADAPLLVQAAVDLASTVGTGAAEASGLGAGDEAAAAAAAALSAGVQVATDAEAWLEGKDPFVEYTSDPAQACALQSSLLEIQALCEHYCPDVARLAKLFFAETAPKVGHNIDHFTTHTYGNIIEYESEHRKNRIASRAFEKPQTLLGRSARALTSDEKFDEEARAKVLALNKMPGLLETVFST